MDLEPPKFRAWDNQDKVMRPVNAITWEYDMHWSGGKADVYQKQLYATMAKPGYWDGLSANGIENEPVLYDLKRPMLMQFLGTYGRNNAELYVGDFYVLDNRRKNQWIYLASSVQEFYENKGYEEGEMGADYQKTLKIVGNVYANPEMRPTRPMTYPA